MKQVLRKGEWLKSRYSSSLNDSASVDLHTGSEQCRWNKKSSRKGNDEMQTRFEFLNIKYFWKWFSETAKVNIRAMINEKSSLLLRCYLLSWVEEALTSILNETSSDVKFLTLLLKKVYCHALIYYTSRKKKRGI